MTDLAERLASVRSEIVDAARSAERDPASITTIVVTKFHPASLVAELAKLGVSEVGESRHQEARAKAQELALLHLRWHFIGQLQSNKARQVRRYARVVHSIDRVELVSALEVGADAHGGGVGVPRLGADAHGGGAGVPRLGAGTHGGGVGVPRLGVDAHGEGVAPPEPGRNVLGGDVGPPGASAGPLDCFIQVNLDDPDAAGSARGGGGAPTSALAPLAGATEGADGVPGGSRGGTLPHLVEHLAERIAAAPSLRLLGLMTVAPLGEPPRQIFARLRALSERVQQIVPDASALSMGMSGDYREAILEGATHLRIGSAITGKRVNIG